MNCCSVVGADTGLLFSRFAGLDRLRFRLFGFERNQRQLIDGIRATGIEGAELLEVGCGAGHLHHALLHAGAATATGVDLSDGMLSRARAGAHASGLEARTVYHLGDFVRIDQLLPEADVTILDKVVCCYPDWQRLLDRSLKKTRRVYALTYPRDRALLRAGARCAAWALGLIGCCYRPYIHDPRQIEASILAHGFYKAGEAQTPVWLTQIYTRNADPATH